MRDGFVDGFVDGREREEIYGREMRDKEAVETGHSHSLGIDARILLCWAIHDVESNCLLCLLFEWTIPRSKVRIPTSVVLLSRLR